MSKRPAVTRKKQLLIGGVALGVIALAASGYYGYQWYQGQQTAKVAKTAEIEKEVKALSVAGDQDLATQYVTALKANDTTKARKVFTDRITKESDVNRKLELLTQNVQLALASHSPDEAMVAAEQAIALKADDSTYTQAAAVAVAKHDTPLQISYLEKAVAAVSASTNPRKDQLLKYYRDQIESAQQQQLNIDRAKQS